MIRHAMRYYLTAVDGYALLGVVVLSGFDFADIFDNVDVDSVFDFIVSNLPHLVHHGSRWAVAW